MCSFYGFFSILALELKKNKYIILIIFNLDREKQKNKGE